MHVRLSRFNSLPTTCFLALLTSTGFHNVRLKKILIFTLTVLFLEIVLAIAGCSTKNAPQSVAPASSDQIGPLPPLPPGKHAALIADPNPIKVCDGSGLGITILALTIERPVQVVNVRVDSPGGPQLASKAESSHVTTGKWVVDGMVFYLQDVTGGKSLTPENTLATVTVRVTNEGCP